MKNKRKEKNSKVWLPAKTAKILVLVISGILALLSLILPEVINQPAFQMTIGEVSTQEILAPYTLTYESEVLTEKAQQEAAANIEPIYLQTDPSIGRHQIENLRIILYYISTIRQDTYASSEEKLADLSAIEEINFSEETAQRILSIIDSRWQAIEDEAASVLEQVMRNTIRSHSTLTAKGNVPSLIDFSFPQDQAAVIIELVTPFIVPNSLYSEEQTQLARDEAYLSVEPIISSFITGEILVQRGQIIRAEDWEALNAYNLVQPEDRYQEIASAAIIVIVVCLFIGFYFTRRQLGAIDDLKSIILIAVTFITFLALARFVIIDRTILPYLYPLAAFSLTLTIIFNLEIGIVFTIALGILTAYGTPSGFDLTLFYIIPSLIGMLTIGKARRIASFFGSGVSVGLAGAGIILAYRLPDSVTDWIGIATLSGASLFNGLAAASLTLLLQYVYSQLLSTTTPLQLLDTSRPDHPLLQFILRNAPGTYQHSLQVSNLAEQAAEAIGADALLVRVGAIYHDCGKALNPHFFIENQVPDQLNPHDDLDPVITAATIIKHVSDGEELARKYRLPPRIIDFIKEHHGTLLTRYQYMQALKSAAKPEDVDKKLFRYPGPKPQSRETALLMLADSTEARARAKVPKDEEELRALIQKVFDFSKHEGQLDNTDLTLKDIETAADSFFKTLLGTYHPRILYPELKPSQKTDQPENLNSTTLTKKRTRRLKHD